VRTLRSHTATHYNS